MATERKLVCPECKKEIIFDLHDITSGVFTSRCPDCNSVLRIKKSTAPTAESSVPITGQPEQNTGANMEDAGAELLDLARKLEMEMGFILDDPDGAPAEVEKNFPAESGFSPEGTDGPLIPENIPAAPETSGKKLLAGYSHEKYREYEEGETEAWDLEWTRFAVKKEVAPDPSRIDMDELPAAAPGLRDTLVKLRRAETLNLRGENLVRKNLYDEAIKDFSGALDINPDYVEALINRGSVYARLGRFNDALQDYNQALKFAKNDAELYNRRGEVYMQNHMHDQAIKDFTAALVLDPMYKNAYLNRSRVYSEKGLPQEAMADINQAIKVNPAYTTGFNDPTAPAVDTDENITCNREEAAKFNRQGLAGMIRKQYGEAVADFTRVIHLLPGDADGYFNRGRAYIGLGKLDEALADFNLAVLFDSLNARLYYWRAQAWKAKKDKVNMIEDLKLACELGYEPACLAYRKSQPLHK